jgi:hypothetical protein
MVKQNLKPPPKSLRPKTIGRSALDEPKQKINQVFTFKKIK